MSRSRNVSRTTIGWPLCERAGASFQRERYGRCESMHWVLPNAISLDKGDQKTLRSCVGYSREP